jgi:hypothetical protein
MDLFINFSNFGSEYERHCIQGDVSEGLKLVAKIMEPNLTLSPF